MIFLNISLIFRIFSLSWEKRLILDIVSVQEIKVLSCIL